MRISLAVFLSTSAFVHAGMAAEAVTYRGTLAKLPIIVELKEPDAKGNFVGRYSYESKALDIPLHGKVLKNGKFQIREEEPCTEKTCMNNAGEMLEKAPLSFEWTLSKDGANLTGTWIDKKKGKSLPLALTKVGSRTLPESDIVDPTILNPDMIDLSVNTPTKENLPYDALKMEFPLKAGDTQKIGDVTYRMDVDTRINLAYPTILKAGSFEPGPVNDYIKQRRFEVSIDTFSCLAATYLSYGWSGTFAEANTKVAVEYASEHLFGFAENADFYCGGAHPNITTKHKLVDVETGEDVFPETLLSGLVAKDYDGKVVDAVEADNPSSLIYETNEKLVKYILDHLDPAIDPALTSECGYPDLIKTNLAVYFTPDNLVFTLRELPQVSAACAVDLTKVPLKDAGPYLNKEGKSYFEGIVK